MVKEPTGNLIMDSEMKPSTGEMLLAGVMPEIPTVVCVPLAWVYSLLPTVDRASANSPLGRSTSDTRLPGSSPMSLAAEVLIEIVTLFLVRYARTVDLHSFELKT